MTMKWIVVILFVAGLIAIYFYSRRCKHKNRKQDKFSERKKEIIDSKVDFKNIFQSSFEATSLYNKLKIKYHPDRFLDPKAKEIATQIYQEITSNKHDYNKLLEIRAIAEKELQTR